MRTMDISITASDFTSAFTTAMQSAETAMGQRPISYTVHVTPATIAGTGEVISWEYDFGFMLERHEL